MATTYSRFHPGQRGLILDWETSGADFDAGDSARRFQGISFGAVICDLQTFNEVESLYREVQFDEKKYKWTARAEEIHGLSREYLAENGVPREQALTDLLDLIDRHIGLGRTITIGGHNISFDIDFLNQLTFDCAGILLPLHHVRLETSSIGFVCTGIHRSTDLFEFFGGEKRGKHNALQDAQQTLAVLRGVRALCNSALGIV